MFDYFDIAVVIFALIGLAFHLIFITKTRGSRAPTGNESPTRARARAKGEGLRGGRGGGIFPHPQPTPLLSLCACA